MFISLPAFHYHFCCGILKSLFPNEHCYKEIHFYAVTTSISSGGEIQQSGQYPQWKTVLHFQFTGRSPTHPSNVLPRQPVHGYHFSTIRLTLFNGLPPYAPSDTVTLGQGDCWRPRRSKMAENLFFQRIRHDILFPVVHIL